MARFGKTILQKTLSHLLGIYTSASASAQICKPWLVIRVIFLAFFVPIQFLKPAFISSSLISLAEYYIKILLKAEMKYIFIIYSFFLIL